MNDLSDQQLLQDYAGRRFEAAFVELVRRHVDLVYSAALRMVRDTHSAQDVTQAVFVALAQQSRQLSNRPVLSGWLHCTARNLAAKAIRTEVRRRAREQEAAAMNELLSATDDASWEHIAPHFDAALGDLSEPDRDALLLRYFERKSAREMAQILGINDEAAQKRVSRAVERLRAFFAKRGVTVGASGLAVVISANAVQAAPAGLAVTISTAAALAGASIVATTAATATKAIAMTTLQKTLLAATLTAAIGAGIYEARQIADLRGQVQALQQQQSPLAERIEQLTRERDEARNDRTAEHGSTALSPDSQSELLRLRGEVTRLRAMEQHLAQLKSTAATNRDPFTQSVLALTARAAELNQQLERMPDKRIPELQFLTESDWLTAAKDASFLNEADIRQALSKLRSLAKSRFGMLATHALDKFIQQNNGQLPADPIQLQPHFEVPVDELTLQRYRMLHTGNVKDLPKDTVWTMSEKSPVDRDYDSHFYIGPNGRTGSWGTGRGQTGDPDATWATR